MSPVAGCCFWREALERTIYPAGDRQQQQLWYRGFTSTVAASGEISGLPVTAGAGAAAVAVEKKVTAENMHLRFYPPS